MAACTLPCNSNLPQTLKRQNISKQRNYYQDKVFQQLSTAVYSQNYLHKLGNNAKISPLCSPKTALSKRENHSTNIAF